MNEPPTNADREVRSGRATTRSDLPSSRFETAYYEAEMSGMETEES
jgi:hypothetical protein